MKLYRCKMCKARNIEITGARFQIRKHIQEEHFIKSEKAMKEPGNKYTSPVSQKIEVIEIS